MLVQVHLYSFFPCRLNCALITPAVHFIECILLFVAVVFVYFPHVGLHSWLLSISFKLYHMEERWLSSDRSL